MDTTGASPYGTRSRNRTGNPRPNYAEDRKHKSQQDTEIILPLGKLAESSKNNDTSPTLTGDTSLTTSLSIFRNLKPGEGTLYSLPHELVDNIYEILFTDGDRPPTEGIQSSGARLNEPDR